MKGLAHGMQHDGQWPGHPMTEGDSHISHTKLTTSRQTTSRLLKTDEEDLTFRHKLLHHLPHNAIIMAGFCGGESGHCASRPQNFNPVLSIFFSNCWWIAAFYLLNLILSVTLFYSSMCWFLIKMWNTLEQRLWSYWHLKIICTITHHGGKMQIKLFLVASF